MRTGFQVLSTHIKAGMAAPVTPALEAKPGKADPVLMVSEFNDVSAKSSERLCLKHEKH